MSDLPEVKPGQFWRLWVYDDAYRETILVKEVTGHNVWGVTKDGSNCGVGLRRLQESGTQIDPPRYFGLELDIRLPHVDPEEVDGSGGPMGI